MQLPSLSRKHKLIAAVLLVLIPVLLGTALLGWSRSDRLAPAKARDFLVAPRQCDYTIRQRGILTSADFDLAVAKTHGFIQEIVPQGTPVKKGDFIFQIDDSLTRDQLETYEDNIDKEELNLALTQAQYQQAAFQQNEEMKLYQAELEHAQLQEREELATPTPEDLRLLEIEKALTELDCQDAQEDYKRQSALADKGFISASALEPYARRLTTTQAMFEEVELKIRISKKGIPEARRIELRRAVERAQAMLTRSQQRLQRKLGELKKKIEVSEKRLEEYRHYTQRYKQEIAEATVHAKRDGIVKLGTYRDWRGGGRLREYQAGIERWPNDAVAEVINPELMKIKLVINQADFAVLKAGLPVRITMPAFPDRIFPGKLQQLGAIGRDRNRIDPTAQSGGRSEIPMFNAEIKFDTSGVPCQPGMSAMVEIIVDPPEERLLIPRQAVQPLPQGFMVLCKEAEDFQPREITGRVFNDLYFWVKTGLKTGDRIALNPQPEASDG
jgi:multidrug resistance efflux pump